MNACAGTEYQPSGISSKIDLRVSSSAGSVVDGRYQTSFGCAPSRCSASAALPWSASRALVSGAEEPSSVVVPPESASCSSVPPPSSPG